MLYISLFLSFIGLYNFIFRNIFRFKKYYLGLYFNRIFGLLLFIFNIILFVINIVFDMEIFSFIFPLIIGIILLKIKEKDFNYFLIKDEYYENKIIDKPIRKTVRGIVINSKNEVGFIHIKFDDPLFGYRDHYELPGGGIESDENPIKAIKREMEEELGYTIKDIHYLCDCAIEYNPFNRIDYASVFVCKVDEKTQTNFQGIEKDFIVGIEFIPLNEIIEIYKNSKQDKVTKMIYNRDSRLINLYNKYK